MTKFQEYARAKYTAGGERDEMWHPDVLAECDVIDREAAAEARRQREADQKRIQQVVGNLEDLAVLYKGFVIVGAQFRGSIQTTKKMSKAEINKLLEPLSEKEREEAKETITTSGKRLFSLKGFDELDAIESAKARWRQEIHRFGLPFRGKGDTIMRVALIPKVDDLQKLINQELPKLVDKLIAAYPVAIMPETVKSKFYDPADYRKVETLRDLFRFRIDWLGFASEEMLMQQLSESRVEANRLSIASAFEEVKQGGILLLRKEFAELTQTLSEAMTPNAKGDKKKFYDSSVTNILEALDDFKNRNIADDKELEAELEKLRQMVQGKDVKAFKNDDTLRQQTKVNMEAMTQTLKGMIATASTRSIILED